MLSQMLSHCEGNAKCIDSSVYFFLLLLSSGLSKGTCSKCNFLQEHPKRSLGPCRLSVSERLFPPAHLSLEWIFDRVDTGIAHWVTAAGFTVCVTLHYVFSFSLLFMRRYFPARGWYQPHFCQLSEGRTHQLQFYLSDSYFSVFCGLSLSWNKSLRDRHTVQQNKIRSRDPHFSYKMPVHYRLSLLVCGTVFSVLSLRP